MRRYHIEVTGVVQGVGFRPFIYNLAKSLGLKGWVNNAGAAVAIEVEGERDVVDAFIRRIEDEAPPLSIIKSISVRELDAGNFEGFEIIESVRSREQSIFISPDVSVCDKCIGELFDKDNRRYLYPFINCTDCGPRFTITRDMPYDRATTTMSVFTMCSKCAEEYACPLDRRYHAQPISCYDCGPRLELVDRCGVRLDVQDPISYARSLILKGNIIAIKGLGGYHLACDAKNHGAVAALRKRKARDDKPFAIMVRDYATALKYCIINEEEKRLLESGKKPIVLLRKREGCSLPEDIAPLNPYLGVMLPYTPVHLLIFGQPQETCGLGSHGAVEALVMTSGNRSSEPIYYKDAEALENLGDIADYFLTNDREIYTRADDSVTRVFRGREYIIRRSRGYVPLPVFCETAERFCIERGKEPSVLAVGGELKNTFCMNRGSEFYLSHYIGDLENAETLLSFEEGIEHFRRLFNLRPEAVAYDLHPDYLSSRYALSLDMSCKVPVQHHHAHIAACMAENGLDGDVIGVAFDGTGFGEDGHIWGGEFFAGGYRGFARMGHLEYVNMPGGEAAVKEPWRMAASYLYKVYGGRLCRSGGDTGVELEGHLWLPGIDAGKISAIVQMMEKGVNSPLTSSVGRLFDAVSALLGIRYRISYEGQAAAELEYISEAGRNSGYSFSIEDGGDVFSVCVSDTIRDIMRDARGGVAPGVISSKFHETVAGIVLEGCRHIRRKTGINVVVLSGGVFQNITLLEKSLSKLENEGFRTYIHSRVPTNDGGISLGQAVIAAAKLAF